MSITKAMRHLRQAEQELLYQNRSVTMYIFVYQQLIDAEWAPAFQCIAGFSIADAMYDLMRTIEAKKIKIRGICYGTYLEMEYLIQPIRDYWQRRGQQEKTFYEQTTLPMEAMML